MKICDLGNRDDRKGHAMSAQIFVPMLFGILLGVCGAIVVMTWYRSRGRRIVKCPETGKLAAVELDRGRAIASALCEGAALRVKNCSRWPEHEKCDHGCAAAAALAKRVGEA